MEQAEVTEIKPQYLEALHLVERCIAACFDVHQDEFEPAPGVHDLSTPSRRCHLNIGDKELTRANCGTRYYLGSNVSLQRSRNWSRWAIWHHAARGVDRRSVRISPDEKGRDIQTTLVRLAV